MHRADGGRSWLELRTFPAPSRRPLTPAPAQGERRNDGGAAFSPDGTRLAFHRGTRRTEKVLLLELGTGRLSTLAVRPRPGRFDEVLGAPSWTADGAAVVFAESRRGTVTRLHRVEPGGRASALRIPPWRRGDSIAATSPDGRAALVIRHPADWDGLVHHYEGPSFLQLVGPAGARMLARSDYIERASWSPDGLLVAYTAGCTGVCDLVVVRPDGTGRRRLTRFTTPAFPDGGFDALDVEWGAARGEILIARGRSVLAVDAATGTRRRVATLPCPVRRCRPSVELLHVARERRLAFVSLTHWPAPVSCEAVCDPSDPVPRVRYYRVSLDDGHAVAMPELAAALDVHVDAAAAP